MAYAFVARGNIVANGLDGITSYVCDDSVMAENVLLQLTYPVSVLSSRNVIRDNVVEGKAGGQIVVQGNDNQFFHNDFIAAPKPAVQFGTGNIFNLPAPDGGNYWSDFPCTDANRDGFCDSPVVFWGGSDELPFASPGGWKTIPVQIDIKPGEYPNAIHLGSNGSVPVAILSAASFDAAQIDPQTITLSSAPVQLSGHGLIASLQDVNGDNLVDLVVQISTEAVILVDTDKVATLDGKTFGGMAVQGSDSVRIVP